MNILVTGSSGYVGQNLVTYLRRRNFKVAGLDRRGTAVNLGGDIRILESADLALYDAIVHAASLTGVRTNWEGENAAKMFAENTEVMGHLLDVAGDKRVVFLSTAAVYGGLRPNTLYAEDMATEPLSPYAASKVACEALVAAYAHRHSVRHASLRLSSVVGGVGYKMGHIADFVRCARERGTVHALSSGTAMRPHVHVDDVCTAVEVILRSEHSRGTYNVNSGYWRCKDTVSAMGCGASWRDDLEQAWPGDNAMMLSTARLHALGFEAGGKVAEGVRETLKGLGW